MGQTNIKHKIVLYLVHHKYNDYHTTVHVVLVLMLAHAGIILESKHSSTYFNNQTVCYGIRFVYTQLLVTKDGLVV